jgi:hypothetical protein
MSKLEPNEQNYLRSLTKGFTPEEMAEVYNNAHRKGYFELMDAATRIKEKKEENVPDTQAPREAATPIAMGELSTGGAAEIFKSAGRLVGEYSSHLYITFADWQLKRREILSISPRMMKTQTAHRQLLKPRRLPVRMTSLSRQPKAP